MKPIKLKDVASELETVSQDFEIFLNIKTGEFQGVVSEYYRDELNEEVVEEIEENYEDYVKLPTQFYINEYEIMQDFAYRRESDKESNQLLYAIRGKGAFRRFKDKLYDLSIQEEYYDFLSKSYLEMAREWCDSNKIPYIE